MSLEDEQKIIDLCFMGSLEWMAPILISADLTQKQARLVLVGIKKLSDEGLLTTLRSEDS